jgi:arylsulfatase A-like enzyme
MAAEMAQRDGTRWFLWVHLWEPHQPYEPPSGQRRRFALGDIGDLDAYAEPARFLSEGEIIPAEDVARSASLYDGEIAAADVAVAKIVRAVHEARPDDSPPLIMIVSDHGESLGERQTSRRIGFGHGTLLHQEQVKVPWITVWESRVVQAVLQAHVSLVDLAPTIMDLVDPDRRYQTEGRSLATSLSSGEEPSPGTFFLERRLFDSRDHAELAHPETAIVDYPWKLIENAGVGRLELYDLAADPDERVELSAQRGDIAADLRRRLAAWLAEHPLPRQRGATSRAEEQRRLREQAALRSLGYID